MGFNISYLVRTSCTTYNQSAYITDAFNGFVMQQTLFPYVCTIIDDASTDGEQEIIKNYLHEHFDLQNASVAYEKDTDYGHITFARHKTNENCYFAVIYLKENHYSQRRSKAPYLMEWMDTKYVAICEGDDYWTDPLKLQKQVDFLEGHKDYSMCCTGFSQTFEGNEIEKSPMVFDLDDITIEHLIKGQWIGTATVVYRRESMIDYKLPFSSLPFGDVPMWFHLALKGKIKYLKDITANYRRLNDSACHFSDKKKEYLFGLDVMRVREFYAKLVDMTSVAQPMFSKDSHYYLEQCYQNQWFDFPMDTLWHFIKEYGHPSGYDKLKHWGMKSKLRYRFSKEVLSVLKK